MWQARCWENSSKKNFRVPMLMKLVSIFFFTTRIYHVVKSAMRKME